MKKSILSKIMAVVLCLVLTLSTFTFNVFAANEDADLDMGEDVIIQTLDHVYVSSAGSDSNAGTEASPFATLDKATARVSSGGTIHIVGTYNVPSNTNWASNRTTIEPVTITGGTLSLASNDLVIGYNVIFKDITINGGKSLYANGNAVTFTSGANASAVTVYGGGKSGEALKSTKLTIEGGTLGTVYGGGYNNSAIDNVNLTITGGTINSVFGGNSGASLTGNVTVFINGGTISRRIFGGCNNEFTYKPGYIGNVGASITWNTAYYITGKVDVIVSEKATINTNSSSESDKAFFAHSRHKTLQANEDTSIIFTSQTAYDNNSNKFGTKESKSSWGTSNNLAGAGMGSNAASAADNIHIHGLTSDDTTDTISETCTISVGTENNPCTQNSVTLTLDKKASLVYTGEEIIPMFAEIVGELSLEEPVITYSNNVNPGQATATMSYAGSSVSQTFTIQKQSQSAPHLVSAPETISGKADGQIYGLTQEMEISTDGSTFAPLTDVNISFSVGTYYVRYFETEFKNVSPTTTVVVEAGKKLVVTYVADGEIVATVEVDYGANAVAPAIPSKDGYTYIAPYWDIEAKNVTSDMTVTAIYTKNYVLGDTDGDEIANLNDLITLAQYVAEWQNITTNNYALDINGDGKVDLADVNNLAQYFAGWNVTIATVPYMG